MSCGKCPDFSDKIEEKYKKFDLTGEEKKQEAEAPQPEPQKERKKSWWQKLKDRIDPAGIGGLPDLSMGF